MQISIVAFIVLLASMLCAASVNGALGYGFSSVVVPISLTVVASRVLNPVLVLLEVVLNISALVLHRRHVPAVWRRVWPIVVGLLPGVAVGGFLFGAVSAHLLKVSTYLVILPMVALQSFALRWPVRSERRWGVPFGLGLGVLYSTTTVSGPPLAVYFTNLGLVQEEFRAALAMVRVCEAVSTLCAYAVVGALTMQSAELAAIFLPVVILGLVAGRRLIRRLDRQLFSRICMRVDAVLVTVGLALTTSAAGWLPAPAAWAAAVAFALALHVLAAGRARRRTLGVAASGAAA